MAAPRAAGDGEPDEAHEHVGQLLGIKLAGIHSRRCVLCGAKRDDGAALSAMTENDVVDAGAMYSVVFRVGNWICARHRNAEGKVVRRRIEWQPTNVQASRDGPVAGRRVATARHDVVAIPAHIATYVGLLEKRVRELAREPPDPQRHVRMMPHYSSDDEEPAERAGEPAAVLCSRVEALPDPYLRTAIGAPTAAALEALYADVTTELTRGEHGGAGRQLFSGVDARQVLVLTLFRMRTGQSYFEVSLTSGIPIATLHRQFGCMLTVLRRVMQHTRAIHLLSLDELKQCGYREGFEADLPRSSLIADCTYIFVEKSTDGATKRREFSKYKGCNLVKFLIMCAPNGFIQVVDGPWGSDGDGVDGRVLAISLFHPSVQAWVRLSRKDVVVVDRGFLSQEYFDLMHYARCASMEAFDLVGPRMGKGHSPVEAAMSSVVTRHRGAIEVVNRRVKEWRILDGRLPASLKFHIRRLVYVACGLVNRWATLLPFERQGK